MKVRFTSRADADIIDCYLYGCRNFGLRRAERYERSLRHAITLIADNPRLAVERPQYRPPVRIHRHAKHHIIYRIETDYVLIVRVLREDVDLGRHL